VDEYEWMQMEREAIDWKARASARRGVSHKATVKTGDGREFLVLVTNLSYNGCHMLSETSFDIGEAVILTLPGRGSLSAQVRWTAGDCAGLQFLLGDSTAEERRVRIGV
jgi:hypothetical protein